MNGNEVVENLTTTLQDLPWSGMIPVIGAILVGIMLWLAGRRVLRMGLGAVGFLQGAIVGWMFADLVTSLPYSIMHLVMALVLAIIFSCIASLMHLVTVACCLAIILGIAAPLSVWALDVRSSQDPTNSLLQESINEETPDNSILDGLRSDEYDDWLGMNRTAEDSPTDELPVHFDLDRGLTFSDVVESQAESMVGIDELHIESIRNYADWGFQQGERLAEQIPPHLIFPMSVATIFGIVIGFMLGALATRFSASIVTAFGGSLLMLGSGHVFLDRAGWFDPSTVLKSPMAWLIVWVSLGIIGTVFQWIIRPRPADKSSD